MLPISEGISPDSSFIPRLRFSRLIRLPISGGLPIDYCSVEIRYSRLVRLPISGGISPDRLL